MPARFDPNDLMEGVEEEKEEEKGEF